MSEIRNIPNTESGICSSEGLLHNRGEIQRREHLFHWQQDSPVAALLALRAYPGESRHDSGESIHPSEPSDITATSTVSFDCQPRLHIPVFQMEIA